MLFKNRWYRTYFELVDAFRSARCPLCHLLSERESAMIGSLVASYKEPRRSRIQLKTLCVGHRGRLKEAGAGDPAFSAILKTLVKSSLWDMTRSSEGPTASWRRWLRAAPAVCPLCSGLLAEEGILCHALVGFLDDTEFWKGLQRSALLCLNHLEKCLAVQDRTNGRARLRDDQSEKLNRLLDDLIRFEATGTNAECKSTALEWVAGFTTGWASGSEAAACAVVDGTSRGGLSATHDEDDASDDEATRFENEKLKRKVQDLIDSLNRVETRAAALHYRCAELDETNKRLEMGYTGASTQARGLESLVRDLREEIEKLKKENMEHGAKAAS